MPPLIRPVIFGEVLYDRFPDGQSVLGGAPFNVAWHLQAFGAEPLMVSRVGDDAAGRQVLAAMRDWGMDCSGMQSDRRHPTGAVEVTLRQGEPSYHIVPDQAYDFIAADELPQPAPGWLLYHGSLACRNTVSAAALQALKGRTSGGTFVDINLRSPWWTRESVLPLLHDARWLKLNADELQQLQLPAMPDGAQDYLVVTHGKLGARAHPRDGAACAVRPATQVAVMDSVGAGDAFSSVLLLGLLRHWPLPLAMDRAQQFASAVVGLRGATTCDHSFYEPYFRAWT